MAPEDCLPLQKDLLPSAAEVAHLVRARRSIRTFKEEPLPREVLAQLIDTARYAPTGSNRQQVRWLVVYASQEVQRLARLTADWLRHLAVSQPGTMTATYLDSLKLASERGVDLTCRGAPHLVIAYGPRGREADGVIALSYLELAAYAAGVGTCWGGFVNSAAHEWPPMREALGLPEGTVSYGAMMMGYPKYGYRRLPRRHEAQVTWR